MKTALMILNPQSDFIPSLEENDTKEKGGEMFVKDADKIIPIINWLIENVHFDITIFTGYMHQKDNVYFASQHEGYEPYDQKEINGKMSMLYPDHCVQLTPGFKFHPDLKIPIDSFIIYKGIKGNDYCFSDFGSEEEFTGLNNFLKDKDVEEIYIVGIEIDRHIKKTSIDAVNEGYETIVILDGCNNTSTDKNTLNEMIDEGVQLFKGDIYEIIKK